MLVRKKIRVQQDEQRARQQGVRLPPIENPPVPPAEESATAEPAAEEAAAVEPAIEKPEAERNIWEHVIHVNTQGRRR